MKINKQKLLFSFCLTIIILCMLPFGAAYADNIESLFKRFMDASLRANQINMTAIGLGIADGVRDTLDFLAYPFRVIANDFVHVEYTTPIESIDEYFNRSKLTIRPNAILIDDVPYTNIWLSKDASEEFRINSFDIITAWNIASESNGTFVSGIGTVCDIPIYAFNQQLGGSPRYNFPNSIPLNSPELYTVGTVNILKFSERQGENIKLYWTVSYPDNYTQTKNYNPSNNFYCQVNVTNPAFSSIKANVNVYNGGVAVIRQYNLSSGYIDLTPFSFDWVSAEIPVDAELPADYGLNIQIPTSYVNNWLIDYGDTYINQDLDLDTTNNNLMVAINDLMEIVNNNTYVDDSDIFISYDTDIGPTPPTPTPTPTPPPSPTPPIPTPSPAPGSDIISDTPWAFLESWLQSIRDILRAIYDYVQQIVEYYLENIYADLYLLEQKIEEIIDKLDDIGDDISNKLSLIYADIGDITVDIGSFLDDFIIDLEQAPIKLADKTIDILKLAFLPILTRLRNSLGIWHYVTEWLTSISNPFSYFLNILSSAYPAAMTPIYACVAGTLCILVYKRFGR